MLRILMLAGLCFSCNLYAADVTIDITGKITKPTCELDTSSFNSVNLGTKHAGAYKTVLQGDGNAGTPFTIKINCSADTKGVSIIFQGEKDPANGSRYLKVASGGASNVAIGIMTGETEGLLPIGDKSASKDLSVGVNEFTFYAMYIATALPVTIGKATSEATVVLNWS